MEARRVENLKMAAGRLVHRGRGVNHDELIAGGIEILRQLDVDQDGYLTSDEVQRLIEGFGLQLPPGGIPPFRTPLSPEGLVEGILNNGNPFAPGEVPLPPEEAPLAPGEGAPAPDDANPPPAGGNSAAPPSPLPPGAQKGDGLPDAASIMENLDKNHDGVLEPSETVDRLAQNFKMLDKDKSGTLDKSEIERGLRLARMFGVKPERNPLEYKAKSAPAAKPQAKPTPDAPLKESEPSPRKI
jgi:hypothetical protein